MYRRSGPMPLRPRWACSSMNRRIDPPESRRCDQRLSTRRSARSDRWVANSSHREELRTDDRDAVESGGPGPVGGGGRCGAATDPRSGWFCSPESPGSDEAHIPRAPTSARRSDARGLLRDRSRAPPSIRARATWSAEHPVARSTSSVTALPIATIVRTVGRTSGEYPRSRICDERHRAVLGFREVQDCVVGPSGHDPGGCGPGQRGRLPGANRPNHPVLVFRTGGISAGSEEQNEGFLREGGC